MSITMAIDCSLSMGVSDCSSPSSSSPVKTRLATAIDGVAHFLTKLTPETTVQQRLTVIRFNHAVETIKGNEGEMLDALHKIRVSSKALFSPLLSHFTASPSKHLIILTDCSTLSQEIVSECVQYTDGSTIHVLCLCSKRNLHSGQLQFLREMQTRVNRDTSIGPLLLCEFASITTMIDALFANHFSPMQRILRCGFLSTPVQIFPVPDGVARNRIEPELEVMAFVRPAALSNCPTISHHLLIPGGDSQTPPAGNLASLLAQSLKAENMTALCQLSKQWFSFLYFSNTSSNTVQLAMHCLPFGNEAVPWLGCLDSASIVPYTTGTISDVLHGTGRMPTHRPSYTAGATTSWLQPYGLQADVSKVLRYMKKLPDRHGQFYQEVNRVCQYALALGFTQLLDGLADLLQSESINASTHAQNHCNHVARILRNRDFVHGKNIEPPTA